MSVKAETKFKEKVQKYLSTLDNCWSMKVYGNAIQKGGIPDILICYKGYFIAMELKDPDEDNDYGATRRQLANLNRIRKAGGLGYVIDNLEQVKTILEDLNEKH